MLNRRQFIGATLAAGILGSIPSTLSAEDSSKPAAATKMLIVYYSWGGNTRVIAKELEKLTGATVLELIPQEPYPTEYRACTDLAKKHIADGILPALKGKIKDIDQYDVILIGSPNWWGTIAPPVATFIAKHLPQGKKVLPFITHGGGGEQRCFTDIAKQCKGCTVTEGFLCNGSEVAKQTEALTAWLKKNKIVLK